MWANNFKNKYSRWYLRNKITCKFNKTIKKYFTINPLLYSLEELLKFKTIDFIQL